MYAVEKYAAVRQFVVVEGRRRRKAALMFGISRDTAAKMCVSRSIQVGRDLAAWIGLVAKPHATDGKVRLEGISKLGERYLRRLLVVGGTSIVRLARIFPWEYRWVAKLLAKKPANVVAIAVANRLAGIAWAIISTGQPYRTRVRTTVHS